MLPGLWLNHKADCALLLPDIDRLTETIFMFPKNDLSSLFVCLYLFLQTFRLPFHFVHGLYLWANETFERSESVISIKRQLLSESVHRQLLLQTGFHYTMVI